LSSSGPDRWIQEVAAHILKKRNTNRKVQTVERWIPACAGMTKEQDFLKVIDYFNI